MTKKPVGDLSYRMHNAIDMLVDAGLPWPARVLEEAESALVTLDAENDRLLAERDAALARLTKAEAALVKVAVLGGPMYTLLNEMGKDD